MRITLYHNLPSGGAKRSQHEKIIRLAKKHEIHVETLTSANHEFADIGPFVRQYNQHSFQPSRMFKSPFGRLNPLLRWVDLDRLMRVDKNIAQKIEQQQPDIVFANPCRFQGAPSVLRHLKEVPSVYYCHEPLRILYEKMPDRPYYQTEKGLRHLLNRVDPLPKMYKSRLKRNDQENLNQADLVLVNSRYIQRQVREIYGVDAQVCYQGVDAGLFRPLNLPRTYAVLSVGSLTPLKGFDFVIRALARIPKSERPPYWIASNFSNSPEYKYLTELAHDLEVDVQFHGNISDERLVTLYNQAAVTAYAPVREPFGLVALESMACATPVIGIHEGGLLETIDNGLNGLLTERDENDYGDALYSLLTNPDLAREFGQKGRKQVMEKWTWRAAVNRLEKYFLSVAA